MNKFNQNATRKIFKNLSSFNIIINITNKNHYFYFKTNNNSFNSVYNLSRGIQTFPNIIHNNQRRISLLKNQNFIIQQKRWHIHHSHHDEAGLAAALATNSSKYIYLT